MCKMVTMPKHAHPEGLTTDSLSTVGRHRAPEPDFYAQFRANADRDFEARTMGTLGELAGDAIDRAAPMHGAPLRETRDVPGTSRTDVIDISDRITTETFELPARSRTVPFGESATFELPAEFTPPVESHARTGSHRVERPPLGRRWWVLVVMTGALLVGSLLSGPVAELFAR